jgi:hypothetical protein
VSAARIHYIRTFGFAVLATFIQGVRFVLAEVSGLGVDRSGAVVVCACVGADALCLLGPSLCAGLVLTRLRRLLLGFGLGAPSARSLSISRSAGTLRLRGSHPRLAAQLACLLAATVETLAPSRAGECRHHCDEHNRGYDNYDNHSSAHVLPSKSFR